ncbi:AMP-binding enzyme [Nitriliruptor alkaliphilus]|uniref:AMP-binding enzyme n=1 Tax=Nitriliruptor alkaliphilus TaxID=427918 RepID=UPI001B80CA1B|nr:class I adenylate-forming enzyme family protein [Nitriliruptor alkaliphilus]
MEDGYLQHTGRSQELYKCGGERVMPKEIEELLTAHPGSGRAIAVGVRGDRWSRSDACRSSGNPGSRSTRVRFLALCRGRLARFKVPKHVMFVDPEGLPTTPAGKVQKFRLAQEAEKRLEGAAR